MRGSEGIQLLMSYVLGRNEKGRPWQVSCNSSVIYFPVCSAEKAGKVKGLRMGICNVKARKKNAT